MAALEEVFGYRRLLLESKIRLEDAIGWFFNDYIKDEFEIEGFSISLPTEETSWLDKCKAVGPEIERALRAFTLYVKNGSIDTDYFPYVTIKGFGGVPSLLDRKYLVEGEEFELPANLLLSDQSPLAHSSTHPKDGREFCRLVTRLHLTENDFYEVYRPQLKYLIDNGFVETEDDGILQLTSRARLIELVWKRGAARRRDFVRYSEQIEKLVSEKAIAYSSALFSPDEADYLSYMLNNAKFSNALALRNKYDHGGVSPDLDPVGIRHETCVDAVRLDLLVDALLPVRWMQQRADYRRATVLPPLHEFEQYLHLLDGGDGYQEIIQDQKGCPGQVIEGPQVLALGLGLREQVEHALLAFARQCTS